MNNEELNTQLYEKLAAAQDKYRDWLLTQPPEEILKHTYEYTVREDIVMCMEELNLSDAQAQALLSSRAPLDDIYSVFEKRETDHMDAIRDTIEARGKDLAQELRELPVYKNSGTYAREHGELEQYRASGRANIACKEAIEAAISEHYHDNRLHPGAVGKVVEQFGYERTFYVLANTVRQKDWDGRISRENKEWAQTIPVFMNPDSWGDDRNSSFVVDRPHTGLTDLFINQARREYLLTQPLTKQDVEAEAARLLSRLQGEQEPNSPNRTHFMAQISPDFLMRAGTKDRDRLFDLLPFASLTVCSLQDRKGLFALITKDENRDQPLRQRKPSVRDKLQTAAPAPKQTAKKKSKDMEL